MKLCLSLVVCFKTWSKRLVLVAFYLTRCAQFSGEVNVVKMLLSHHCSSLLTEMWMCLLFAVGPVRQTRHLATPRNTIHMSVFSSMSSSGLKLFSAWRAAHAPTTTCGLYRLFRTSLLLLTLVYIHLPRARRENVMKCALSVSPTCHLSLCQSHGQMFLLAG